MEQSPQGVRASSSHPIAPADPPPRRGRAAAGVLLALGATAAALALPSPASRAAWAQAVPRTRVTGTVTGPGGNPLAGVVVRGADTTVTTGANGRFAVNAPPNGRLTFALIGYRPLEVAIDGRTTLAVTLERLVVLQEIVSTGYGGEQRRSDITGAVATVNIDATQRQTSASVLQRLDATVSGVTVAGNGSPGARSTVRIRGISSFQNNEPLYIVDGQPVQDSFINFLNPNDIASIQVLKDASAASIYGSRASNGVIIIETTKRGQAGPPSTRFRVRTGAAAPYRGLDDILLTNSLDYFDVVRESYRNAGFADTDIPSNIFGSANNPSVPQYIWPNNCTPAPCANVDRAAYSFPNNLIMPGSEGTNWFREVFRPAGFADVNADVSGAGPGTTYFAAANYFDQTGTARFNRYRRGTARVNTSFNRGRLTLGENALVAGERNIGGLAGDDFGEGGFLGKNILTQPVVPVYDVGGNFASGKAVGLGNNTNPLKAAWGARDNVTATNRVFGNVFANYDLSPRLAFRTTLGGNIGETAFNGFSPSTPENSEPNFNTSINEWNNRFTEVTWSNTLRYTRPSTRHNLSVLLGQEVNRSNFRRLEGSLSGLVATDPDVRFIGDAVGDASTRNVFSSGGRTALLSYFGKVDYTLADRYVANVTLRRDGSSNLGPGQQWGTFPAVGLGWRVSNEPFLQNNRIFSEVQLRVGWGVTGNQQIAAGRIVSQFGGGRDATFYDITGSGNRIAAGYRQVSIGNPNLRWERNESVNAGVDLGLWQGKVNVIVDLWERTTDNLLFNPALPATAGQADVPIVNIGQMRNRGFDFQVGHRAPSWSVTWNGSAYRNRIQRIDGDAGFFFSPRGTRIGNMVINQVGQPIGAFFGYQADGFFRDAADVAAHATQDGAAPGRIKFRDVNGDGQVTLADRTIIGSPHPTFTSGLDLEFRRGRWDFSGTLFGTFGNEIFDAQKNFYVFRDFSTNVRRDLLENSWRPDNLDAKYPRLDVNDTFSRQISSYYVEDGSFVRLRSLQLGYTLPTFGRIPQGSRVYLLGENLFTRTRYTGLDPSLPPANLNGPAGDIRDQFRAVDEGVYPTSRSLSIGIITSF